MPRNGSGNYALPAGNPVAPNTLIQASWANTTLSDIAQALTNSIASDGQTAPSANLPMAGFRHTNVGAATVGSQYSRADQVQSGELLIATAVAATGNAYTATLPLSIATFTDGQVIWIAFPSDNTGPATLNINGSGVYGVHRSDGSELTSGELLSDQWQPLIWDGGAWRLSANPISLTSLDARYVQLSGSTMTGNLNVNAPTGASSATPRDWVTGQIALTAADYLPLAGGTMLGALLVAATPTLALEATSKQWVESQIVASVGGVASFNTRTGAVTLLTADVTGALGYTPYNATNPSGYISSISSSDVTTALGYTPYNASNPAGYITGINSTMVTTALGYTPFSNAGGSISGNTTIDGKLIADSFFPTTAVSSTGGSVSVNFTTNQCAIITITSPITFTFSGIDVGGIGRLLLKATDVGAVTWPAAVKWPGGITPVLTSGTLKAAMLSFLYDGTYYYGNSSVY